MHTLRVLTVGGYVTGVLASGAIAGAWGAGVAWVVLIATLVTAAAAGREEHPPAQGPWRAVVGCRAGVLLATTLVAAALGVVRGATTIERAAAQRQQELPDEAVEATGTLVTDAAWAEHAVLLSLDLERMQRHGRDLVLDGVRVQVRVAGAHHDRTWTHWTAGRRIRLTVTLRRPVTYRNPGARGRARDALGAEIAWVGSVKSEFLVEILERGTWFEEMTAVVRARVRRVTDRVLGADSAGIVKAILIGDRAGIAPEVEERLQRAGTFHVVAISGGNIAALLGVLSLCWWLLRLPRWARALATASLLAVYAVLVVGSPSVWRAVLVALLCVPAHVCDVRPQPLAVLASAAMLLLAWSPRLLFDVGFQLTVAATLGILVGASLALRLEPAASRARAIGRAMCAALAATLAADVALLPITTSVFHRVTIAGMVLNFVAIPLMTVVQVCGFVLVAADGALTTLSAAAGMGAQAAVEGLLWSARLVDVWPWLSWRVPPPTPAVVVLYVAAWGAWVARGARAKSVADGIAAGAAVTVTAYMALAPDWWSGPVAVRPAHESTARNSTVRELTVVFLDVGQGDATLVRFPTGRAWLVDAGGIPGSTSFDVGARVVAPALWALGVRTLDVLALSHGDPDHAGGAAAVFGDFAPREVWEGVPVAGQRTLDRLHALVPPGRLRSRWRGDVLHVEGVHVRVLNPLPPDWERRKVRNDDSVVLQFDYGAVRIVLPGDIGAAVERELADGVLSAAAPVTVLKVPHHGSASSSSAAWLDALRPSLAVVSAGTNNRFGHPARVVMTRYHRAPVPVARTDALGAIAVTTDGTRARAFAWQGGGWQPVWASTTDNGVGTGEPRALAQDLRP